MRELKKYIVPAVVFVLLFLLLSYKLFYSFGFHPDFARDIYDILTIIQGKLTLIGPKLSFGGIYSGPYYYYLLAPVFYITGLSINALLVFNLILFLGAGVVFYIFASKKYGVAYAILASLTISFLPFYITVSRSPWNGSTYLPILLTYLTLIHFLDFNGKNIPIMLIGFFGGMIVNIHLVSLPVIIVGAIYFFTRLRSKKDFLLFTAGFMISFVPLILFEIKHDFVMFKNTFLVGSYKTFVENNNIPNAVSGKANFFENFFFLSGKLGDQLAVNLFIYLAAFVFLFQLVKSKNERFLIASSTLLVVFFAAVLKYQFGSHYLFPVSVFLVFTLAVVLAKTKLKWLILIFLLIEVNKFPMKIYDNSERKAETYSKRVDFAIENHLIDTGDDFNIVQISKDYTTYIPVGHEYRFFFRKKGFVPKTEYEYNSSDILLVFSELRDFDIGKLDNWEINEFGKQNMQNYVKYNTGDSNLFVFKRNRQN